MPSIADISSLRRSELFGALTPEELDKLAPLCMEISVDQDTHLFSEGREAAYIYLVIEGQISLHKAIRAPSARPPRRTIVSICRARDVVGWSALVTPYKYTLSAVAWDATKLARIDSRLFRRALDMHPHIGFKVMRSLSAIMARHLGQTIDTLVNEREITVSGLRT